MRHRKIPGKKWKGTKDPEAQMAKREESLALKVNAAPSKPDDQEIPKKLARIMRDREELKARGKKGPPRQRVKRDPGDLLDSSKHVGYEMKLPGMTRPLKPVPVFRQQPGESKKTFFRRMDLGVQTMLKRKRYEDKYDVDLYEDPETGNTKVVNREKDEIDELMKAARRGQQTGRGKVSSTSDRSREEKRLLKRAKERERKLKKRNKGKKGPSPEQDLTRRRRNGAEFLTPDDLEMDDDEAKTTNRDGTGPQGEVCKEFRNKDTFRFNEVVHGPPAALAGLDAERRPAKSGNLLLAEKFKQTGPSEGRPPSLHRQQVLEVERLKAIEAYRHLKAKNLRQKTQQQLRRSGP